MFFFFFFFFFSSRRRHTRCLSDWSSDVCSSDLGCIDDARKHPGLILIAATNIYDGLDRSLIREGRFDLHLRLDLPSEEERTRMFGAQLAKRPSRHFDLQPFAKRTPGWSAAKIGTLVDRAAFFAAEEQRKIEERDLARALAETGGNKEEKAKPVEIDLAGFEERVVVLPPKAGRYNALAAVSGKLLYRRLPRVGAGEEKSPVVFYDLEKREEKTVIEDADY